MSRSREIGSLNYRIALKFDKHIGSSVAEGPVSFQSDRTILSTNLTASRLHETKRYDILSHIETGPWPSIRQAIIHASLWNLERGSKKSHGYERKFPNAAQSINSNLAASRVGEILCVFGLVQRHYAIPWFSANVLRTFDPAFCLRRTCIWTGGVNSAPLSS